MRKLNKPMEDAGDVFIKCIEIIRNKKLKTRLAACKDLIKAAAIEFENKITKGELYVMNRETLVNGNVTSKELEDVYTLRMAKKNGPGRRLYNKLLSSPVQGVCPLCSHRLVTTLDHYLPKTQYPRLSVVPINLVPSCSDCNKSKLSKYPTSPEEETIHPYFDFIENDEWLKASVIQKTPPCIKFEVQAPSNWEKLLKKRVKFHFKALSLGKLYSTLAAGELVQINYQLKLLFKIGGMVGVRKYLLEGAQTRSHANINSWQTAMYKAIADDIWFCSGGFKLEL